MRWRVGSEQGDIILFTVYTNLMSSSNLDFMNTRQAIAPRLLAGFRAIDKLYGSSPQRLNEACLISFFAGDNEIPAELMKRIGNDFDLTVWKDASNFNIFRQEALMESGSYLAIVNLLELKNNSPTHSYSSHLLVTHQCQSDCETTPFQNSEKKVKRLVSSKAGHQLGFELIR